MRSRTAVRRAARVAGVVLALGGLAATTACTGDDPEKPSAPATEAVAPTLPASTPAAATPSASPSAVPTSLPPAAQAGGVCASVTFAEVREALGITFEVAAASGKSGGVRTCVLLPLEQSLPDLTFVATPLDGEVSKDDFEKDFVPENADEQNGLGRAAYKQVVAATGQAGPIARIGWLGDETVYTLSLTTEKATGTPGAQAFLPKLVKLAPKLIPS
ncbi:hypothetical protein [Cryptosporangium minutisporangium]|uniref:DUF3558 domain-containing protein n=1 Tax=Cryptosporangium minutisporangium TaxID=113569 RepID=A0ABP6TCG0_9ACTN